NLTFGGMASGFFPRRDMAGLRVQGSVGLVDLAENFAADVLLPRFAVAVYAAGGADDRDAHSSENGPHLLGFAIHAAAGRADALDVLDHVFAVGAVFQLDAELTDRVAFDFLPVPDVTFALQHFGQSAL